MNIIILGQLDSYAIQKLSQNHHVIASSDRIPETKYLANSEILVTRGHVKITCELLQQTPRLRLLIKAGSGVDNINLAETSARNIQVITTPHSTYSVAELVFALLLCVQRKLSLMNTEIRKGNWKAKHQHTGHQLRNSTIGIIGFGRIGRAVAHLGKAFGMNILVFDRSPIATTKQTTSLEVGAKFTDLATLLREADVISLHVPLNDETHHLLGEAELALISPKAVLINTARAELIEKDALIRALEEKRVAGVGLDVHYKEPIAPNDPLLQFPEVICSPHIGAQTFETMVAIGEEVVAVIQEFAQTGKVSSTYHRQCY